MAICRWLGAYGLKARKITLLDALLYEYGLSDSARPNSKSPDTPARRAACPVVCAERLVKGRSYIAHARVGLLVRNNAVVRKFSGDVWSYVDQASGRRKQSRRPEDALSQHTEVWVQPDYIGVVVKRGLKHISAEAASVVASFALRHNKRVFVLTRDGKLIDVAEAELAKYAASIDCIE